MSSSSVSHRNIRRFGIRQFLYALWIVALVLAAVNILAVTRRIQIMGARLLSPQEQSARYIAHSINSLPPHSRILLLLSRRDLVAPWIDYRVNYFVYPHSYDVAWDAWPSDARRRYDRVFAYDTAQTLLAPDWKVGAHGPQASMLIAAGQNLKTALPAPSEISPKTSRLSRVGSNLLGVVSIAGVMLLGLLLLARTAPVAPFEAWWGNLAVAHLVGATALAWLTSEIAMATGHLMLWPVYLIMLLLLIPRRQRSDGGSSWLMAGWRQAAGWLQSGSAQAGPCASSKAANSFPRLALSWLISLVLLLSAFNCLYTGKTFGLEWDGYAIWQFKARGFFQDGNFALLHNPARYAYAHVDYPLLVSLQSWWTYAHIGRVSDRWAQFHNLLFYADLLALFTAAGRRFAPRLAVGIGVALLASLPLAIVHATSGFADMETAAFLLALGVLLAYRQAGDTIPLGLFAWLFAGIVLVKNEGLPAWIGGLLVLACCAPCPSDASASRPSRWKEIAWCGLAAVSAYLPWFFLKRAWHLTSDIVQPIAPPQFTFGLLAWRLEYVLRSLWLSLARIGPWFPCWGLVLLLFTAGAIMAWRCRVQYTAPLWILVLFQFAAYTSIYLITPYSLVWHVSSSLDRLLLHLTPLLLFASLLACFPTNSIRQEDA